MTVPSPKTHGSNGSRQRTFVVPVAELLRQPGSRRHVVHAAPIEDLAVSGSRVPAGVDVAVDVVLESVHDGILVTGTIGSSWEGACRRCLEPAHGELSVEVRELCVLDGDEETTYPLDVDRLDLEPIAHDACILALPLAPLCREGCLGLCPECGANRNVERCACPPSPEIRWGMLSLVRDEAPQVQTARGATLPDGVAGETAD